MTLISFSYDIYKHNTIIIYGHMNNKLNYSFAHIKFGITELKDEFIFLIFTSLLNPQKWGTLKYISPPFLGAGTGLFRSLKSS